MILIILPLQISINEYNCFLQFPYLLSDYFLEINEFDDSFQDLGLLDSRFISSTRPVRFGYFLDIFQNILGSYSL